ncbi:MAG: peptidoglycan hydrolase-like protein with peptidoglycan-binding domain [Bradymonadia bacterium]|jgi:peptidoglycan hydrolase-like protein with peptidoglycan-binding domain
MDFFEIGKEMLKEGSKGDLIEKLQGALKSAGIDTGKADGIFGTKTKAAVEAFQKQAGLDTDGVVGPNTVKALKQAAMEAAKKAAAAKFGGATDAKGAVGDIMGKVGGLFGKK